MSEQQKGKERKPSVDHFSLRLIVIIPVIFVLVSLGVGLLAVALAQSFLRAPVPSSKDLLILYLWIVGLSLCAGLLGSLVAYGITGPVRRAISEARRMISYVGAKPAPIKALNEVGALTELFDQALVSFIELVQAREMLDSVNEGIVALDKNGRVVGMNLEAQDLLEISAAEARHKSLRELLEQMPANSMLLAIADRVLREQEERLHTRVPLSLPSGKKTLLSVKVSPLRLRSQPHEILGIILDFKERLESSAKWPELIGKSPLLTEVLDLVAKIAPTNSTVLITGESGTGKELVANTIHRLSPRSNKPLIKMNCAAIPEGLLESELFGHEKGSFTGAIDRKPGQFELANGGTIFLDEIGEMSASTQSKVLRVIQEKEFMLVGGSETKRVDVRIVAATNKDLPHEVQQGKFREDLFYRLNVITLSVPPLRARKSDIPFLADHLLEETARRNQSEKKSLSRAALDSLLAYSWPGNVRELENALERASLLCSGTVIQPEDLPILRDPSAVDSDGFKQAGSWLGGHASLNETLDAVERELIIQALRRSGGVQVEAAKLLGLQHKNLWHKIKKHRISLANLKDGKNGGR